MESIPGIIHHSWHSFLQPLFDDDRMKYIKYTLLKSCKFWPAGPDIFRVFKMPLDKVRVVLIGQDPYPNGEATGLAFSVNVNYKTTPTMKIIWRELMIDNPTSYQCSLSDWDHEGVFLLNTALTVERRKIGSHSKHWKWFTEKVVEFLAEYNLIWMMWGADAKSLIPKIANCYVCNGKDKLDIDQIKFRLGNEEKHLVHNIILAANHPMAEIYSSNRGNFSGTNHFGKVNQIFKYLNQPQISWK